MSGNKRNGKPPSAPTKDLPYRITVKRTPTSAILNVRYLGPPQTKSYRKLAAFIYLVSADLEEQSEALGATWVIVPEPFNSWIIIEIAKYGAEETTWRFAEEIAATFDRD